MIDLTTGEPPLSLWFGNFYEPAYSDRAFVDEAIREIRAMGFNSVLLDSKAWADFLERFEGGEASPYVATQEYMMRRIAEAGMSHRFLALYLNGDNLYPRIRFSPPVYGESVSAPDGSDGRWYKYWSPAAKASMVRHVRGLLELYSEGQTRLEDGGLEKIPICSMWDPVVAPSFDDEGVRRYRSWLERAYAGDIVSLNAAYATAFKSFGAIRPEDYWYTLRYGEERFTREELESRAPRFRVAADNMRWRLAELREYFLDMEARLHGLRLSSASTSAERKLGEDRTAGPILRLEPNLSQWNFFLTIDGSKLPGVSFGDLWDTANRGIDPWALRDCVDDCSFTLVPVTPEGDPEAWVASCQASMIRSLNKRPGNDRPEREFTVGLFLGRFLFNDVLRFVSPAELIGVAVASGASGIAAYGYGGMDDGGILHRMDESFKASIAAGLEWTKRVIPQRGRKLRSEVAILFPSAMSLFEPLAVEGAAERRLDFLGWYKASGEAGYQPDIIDLGQIREGALEGYKALVLSANDCYSCSPDAEAERAIAAWVESGGTLVHGPDDELAPSLFDIRGVAREKDCADYRDASGRSEGMLVQGDAFRAWDGGEVLATWRTSGERCIARRAFGSGAVVSFGFRYGYSYVSRIAPHVPLSQGNKALYPVTHLERDPWRDILGAAAPRGGRQGTDAGPRSGRDIEIAAFERGWVVVNHSALPYSLSSVEGRRVHQIESGEILMPHAAVFIARDS
jgi:hypothetical protein